MKAPVIRVHHSHARNPVMGIQDDMFRLRGVDLGEKKRKIGDSYRRGWRAADDGVRSYISARLFEFFVWKVGNGP